jgi:thioredoxin reductase (NADPH)
VSGEGGGRLTLLVRAYCHLCDELLAALAPLAAARGLAIDVVDVDAPEHAALEAAWGEAVPVLFAGAPAAAHEVCRYRFDPGRVAAALAAADGIARKPEIR